MCFGWARKTSVCRWIVLKIKQFGATRLTTTPTKTPMMMMMMHAQKRERAWVWSNDRNINNIYECLILYSQRKRWNERHTSQSLQNTRVVALLNNRNCAQSSLSSDLWDTRARVCVCTMGSLKILFRSVKFPKTLPRSTPPSTGWNSRTKCLWVSWSIPCNVRVRTLLLLKRWNSCPKKARGDTV